MYILQHGTGISPTWSNPELNVFFNILFLLGLAIVVPSLIVIFISFFRFKISQKVQIYLSSFTAGLILILGTVGLIAEGIHSLQEHFHETNANSILQTVGIIGSGVFIGVGLVILTKWLLSKNKHELHEHHHSHGHSEAVFNAADIDNKKIKWLPIILLALHRCVDGITLGLMANTSHNDILGFENWGMLIVFIIHLIPTSIIIYFIQLDIHKNNKVKAVGYTILMAVVMVPFTFIGGYLSSLFNDQYWLMPLLFSISGSLMTVMTILEIVPEFIHNRNAGIKEWLGIIASIGFGILLAVVLISVHTHGGDGHSHGSEESTHSIIAKSIQQIFSLY